MSNETEDRFDDAPDGYDDSERDEGGPRQNQLVRRSFEGTVTLMNNAATQALTAKATADINARWMIAMHRPRHMMDTRNAILAECSNPGFAAKAMYAVPRGKTQIRGLSIRFAEAVMVAMGNMGAEAQTLYDSDAERTIRVTVTDYEVNAAWSRDLTIKKTKEVRNQPAGRALGQRTNSYGDNVWLVEATDDDVTTKEGSAISKASRTGILRLVPAWLLNECQEKIQRVMTDKAAADPRAELRKVCDAFSGLNAKPSWIEDWLGHPVDQATPAEIVDLQQLYRAIRDGQTTLVEAAKARKGNGNGNGNGDKPSTGAAAAVARTPRQPRGQSAKSDLAPTGEPSEPERADIARADREAAK